MRSLSVETDVRLSLAPLVVLLAACETDDTSNNPIGVWTAPDAALSVRVVPTSGTAPVSVAVRAEGAWGAAVPGALVGVTVNGEPVELLADGGGVSVLTLDTPGVHVVAASNTVPISVFEDTSALDGMPRALASDTLVAVHPAAGGVIGQSPDGVWWIPNGGEPISVLDVSGSRIVAGSAAGELDNDGITDAIVWMDDTVVVLRGHPVAGHVLAGTIVGAGRVVTSAAIGDANADGHNDIVITWANAPRFDFEVWGGDGGFQFDIDATRQLRHLPYSLSLGDNTGEGRAQITILDDSTFWTRLVASRDSYAETGPLLTNVVFAPNSTSQSGDFDGDALDELFVFGPHMPGVPRDLRMYSMVPDPISGQLGVTIIDSGSLGAHVAIADSDRDKRVDIWLAQESGEVFLRHQVLNAQQQRRVWTVRDPGPVAVADHTADGVPELFTAGPSLWDFTWGGSKDFDGVTWWEPGEGLLIFDTNYTLAPVFTQLSGSPGRIDAFGLSESGVNIELVHNAVFAGVAPQVSEVDRLMISTRNADSVDIAVCGTRVYALTTDQLIEVSLTGAGPAITGTVGIVGSQVACGQGPAGSVAAVLSGGTVRLYGPLLVSLGSEAGADAHDLALGGGVLATCAQEGCGVAVMNDGTVAKTQGGTLTVGELSVVGSGALTVGDFDGNGEQGLFANDADDIVWLQRAGDTLAVRQRAHTRLDSGAPLYAADAFADGRLVLLGSVGGDLAISTGYVDLSTGEGP